MPTPACLFRQARAKRATEPQGEQQSERAESEAAGGQKQHTHRPQRIRARWKMRWTNGGGAPSPQPRVPGGGRACRTLWARWRAGASAPARTDHAGAVNICRLERLRERCPRLLRAAVPSGRARAAERHLLPALIGTNRSPGRGHDFLSTPYCRLFLHTGRDAGAMCAIKRS